MIDVVFTVTIIEVRINYKEDVQKKKK
jgi:hypothetical protein